MKFAIVVLALVAATSAQLNQGQYDPFNQNRYNKPTYRPYRPVSTPAPVYKTYTPAPVYKTYTPAPVYKTYTPAPFASSTYSPVAAAKVSQDAQNADIVKYGNEIYPDGSYNYFYETGNGIAAQEQGTPRVIGGNPPVAPVVAQGSYSFYTPEGQQVVITYTADENGYHPSGSAIPQPPAIPEYILRSIDYNLKNAQKQ